MTHKDTEITYLHLELKSIGDDGSFSGYGSVFGNRDFGGDAIAAGAFKNSLEETKRKNRKIPILWQHDWRAPVGFYSKIQEDKTGLYVEGQLLMEVQQGREAYSLLKAGAISGLSIGYGVKKWEYDEANETRILKEIDLFECSLVTFPMNDEARVSAVKQKVMRGELPTLPEFEKFLRDAGFSRNQSTTIASHGLRPLQSDSAPDQAKKVAALLSNFTLATNG